MSKTESSSLTGFGQNGAGRLAHLERDRWPEFERELGERRFRVVRFIVQHYTDQKKPWEWMVWKCRDWTEVERVLNRHGVAWNYERHGRAQVIVLDGMNIYRCR